MAWLNSHQHLNRILLFYLQLCPPPPLCLRWQKVSWGGARSRERHEHIQEWADWRHRHRRGWLLRPAFRRLTSERHSSSRMQASNMARRCWQMNWPNRWLFRVFRMSVRIQPSKPLGQTTPSSKLSPVWKLDSHWFLIKYSHEIIMSFFLSSSRLPGSAGPPGQFLFL